MKILIKTVSKPNLDCLMQITVDFFFIVVFLLSFLVFSVNTLYSLVAGFLNSLSIYEIQSVQRD